MPSISPNIPPGVARKLPARMTTRIPPRNPPGIPLRTLLRMPWSALGLLLLCAAAPAQAQFSNACQTQFGICSVPPAPVGSYCQCVVTAPDGAILRADQGYRVLGLQQQGVASHCSTPQGFCFIGQAPLGIPCTCGYFQGMTVP